MVFSSERVRPRSERNAITAGLILSSSLLSYEMGNRKSNELSLFRKQWKMFKSGDIFLGDKGFCSYFDIEKIREQNVDSVLTLARRKPVTKSKCLKFFSQNDLLIKWDHPKYNKRLSYSRETLEQLPLALPWEHGSMGSNLYS